MYGLGTTQDGRGTNAAEDCIITVTANLPKRAIQSLVDASARGGTMYPAPTVAAHDVNADDLMMVHDAHRDRNSTLPKVLASPAGMGTGAVAAYPDNQEMQREVLLNNNRFLGIAMDNVSVEKYNEKQGIAVQVCGKRSTIARVDMPIGPAQVTVSLPSELQDARRVQAAWEGGQVKYELRPYEAKTLGSTACTHLSAVLNDRQRYVNSMNPSYQQTMAWLNFADASYNHASASLVLGIYGLVKQGIITVQLNAASPVVPLLPGDAFPTADADSTPAERAEANEAVVSTLAAMLGVIDVTTGTRMAPGVDVPRLVAQRAFFAAGVRRQTLAYIFHDGQQAAFGVGYRLSAAAVGYGGGGGMAGGNAQIDAATGRVRDDTAIGMLLTQQLLHVPLHISGLSNAVRCEQDKIVGRVVKKARAGGKVDLIL